MNIIVPNGFEPNYAAGFIRGLRANDIPLLVVSDDDMADVLTGRKIAHVNLRGSVAPKRSTWSKIRNICRYNGRLLLLLARNRGGVIHFIGTFAGKTTLVDALCLSAIFRLLSRRYIYTAHNVVPHGQEASLAYRILYYWIYRFPHIIVAHTEQVARELEARFDVPRARIRVISIGLNEEVPGTTISRTEARRKLNIGTEGPVALFFGNVERYKGVDLLVEAWSRIRTGGTTLMIVGHARSQEYARAIRNAIAASPKRSSIVWREGFIPNDEISAWLQATDLVVLPYRPTSQSGVLFLCLRFGVPVVATNVGSMADFIDEKSGIIAQTCDASGLAAALDDFFRRRESFDRNAIARRAEKYAWDRQCAPIKDLYE